MDEDLFVFNGIDGQTGDYLFPQWSQQEILGVGKSADSDYLERLSQAWELKQPHMGMIFGFDYKKLGDTGWGVIFHETEDPGVYEALKPLLDLRREEAGERYRECRGEFGYRENDQKRPFLKRNKAATSGAVDPRKFPYYLLIVGSPTKIPFSFQYDLDVQYGVGRIHFDSPEEYGQYAQGVVEANKGRVRRERNAAFFGVSQPGDRSTILSSKFLVEPLRTAIIEPYEKLGWKFDSAMGEEATKSRLTSLLGGEDTPALLFSASHGVGSGMEWKRQESDQGALLCQGYTGGDSRPFYFASEDLSSDANVAGTVTMMFACYGGGTPKFNEFEEYDKAAVRANPKRKPPAAQIAKEAFIASLPKRMLCHPKGGALAVIAHVERALSCSFQNSGDSESSHIAPFESAVKKLLEGFPIGYAMEEFNSKHSELGNDLREKMPELKTMAEPPISVINMLTEYYDTRNYSVIGDPAVTLAIESTPSGPPAAAIGLARG